MSSAKMIQHSVRVKIGAFGLYRRYIEAARLYPEVVRKKLMFNIKELFLIAKNAPCTPQMRLELIERGHKDLITMQRVALLPSELQKPLLLKVISGAYKAPGNETEETISETDR
jgi:hypothetical protein